MSHTNMPEKFHRHSKLYKLNTQKYSKYFVFCYLFSFVFNAQCLSQSTFLRLYLMYLLRPCGMKNMSIKREIVSRLNA